VTQERGVTLCTGVWHGVSSIRSNCASTIGSGVPGIEVHVIRRRRVVQRDHADRDQDGQHGRERAQRVARDLRREADRVLDELLGEPGQHDCDHEQPRSVEIVDLAAGIVLPEDDHGPVPQI
jgi:hypothetical protein